MSTRSPAFALLSDAKNEKLLSVRHANFCETIEIIQKVSKCNVDVKDKALSSSIKILFFNIGNNLY